MCDHLDLIQSETVRLGEQRWAPVFRELDRAKADFPVEVNPTEVQNEGDDNPNHLNVGDNPNDVDTIPDLLGDDNLHLPPGDISEESKKLHAKRVDSLYNKFKKYTTAVPILGFNSSNYDLNLIKKHLPKHLNRATEADYMVKRCNQYTAIATSRFKFLDISNYLAAGCSYSKFLKAYNVSESKSFFPYEWFDDEAKLDFPSLPPYEAFLSELKDASVLEMEYIDWDENGGRGNAPKTGREKQTIYWVYGLTTT